MVKEIMEVDDLIKQCKFDMEKGAKPPVTAGIARWGTALNAADYLVHNFPVLAFAIVKRCSRGLPETKIKAAAAVLTPRGFD